MSEKIIYLDDRLSIPVFYGVNNHNLLFLRNMHPQVNVVARGAELHVAGNEHEIERFVQTLRLAEKYCLQTGCLDEKKLSEIISGEEPFDVPTENLILHGQSGKPILARTANQKRLVREFEDKDLLFAIGPAGSGKTYTAIALAVKALKNKEVKRIILSRPAVEAGEKLGFLPGDMKDKIDPYLQPLYDALQDMLPHQKLQDYLDKGVVQIAPLAFMRGRTLGNAVVILDEAQNTTIPQIKMFLTRLGLGGKIIVTGDLTQIDLPPTQKSGLRDAVERLEGVEGVSVVCFNQKDIVRHPLVTRIIRAYEESPTQ